MNVYPLTKANRIVLARAFRNVKRVDIAIDSVIEGQMGKSFTDDPANPTAFKLQIGPFCYYAGDFESKRAVDLIRSLDPYSLVMAYPIEWIDIARELYGDKLIQFPRYSFSSENLSLGHICDLLHKSPFRSQIVRIDENCLNQLSSESDHFIDISAFESIEDFLDRGMGYCLTDKHMLIAGAYASLVSNTGIEVSIYVMPEYRRKGIATALACALIKDCLEHNACPHWDAANIESCKLAEKLGYVQNGIYEAFFLKR